MNGIETNDGSDNGAAALAGRVLADGAVIADKAVWKVVRRLGAKPMERVREGSREGWWIAAEAYTRFGGEGCGWEGVAVLLDPRPGAALKASVWWGACGAWDLGETCWDLWDHDGGSGADLPLDWSSEDFADALDRAACEVNLDSSAFDELLSDLAGVRLRQADDLAEVALYADRFRSAGSASAGAA